MRNEEGRGGDRGALSGAARQAGLRTLSCVSTLRSFSERFIADTLAPPPCKLSTPFPWGGPEPEGGDFSTAPVATRGGGMSRRYSTPQSCAGGAVHHAHSAWKSRDIRGSKVLAKYLLKWPEPEFDLTSG